MSAWTQIRATLILSSTVILALPGLTAAADYAVAPVSGGGTITGTVRFAGTVPEPEMRMINKDMEVCGEGHRMHKTVSTGPQGGLTDVVIFVEGIEKGKAWSSEDEAPSLLQKDCAFTPYFQGIRLGSEVAVKNGDPVSHNIHTYEIVGRARLSMFNVQQPAGSEFTKKIRMRRSRVIRLECDQHDFMIGWMYAVENPYYTLAGDDGKFSVSDVPPGTHKVKAWHPYLGFQETEVTLSAGGAAEASFEFK